MSYVMQLPTLELFVGDSLSAVYMLHCSVVLQVACSALTPSP